jgi:hypothetical protein
MNIAMESSLVGTELDINNLTTNLSNKITI